MTNDGSSLANFEDVLHQDGLQAGLAFLNERVPHRYTLVYRLEHDTLNRVAFVDKQGTPGRHLEKSPFKESFCAVLVEAGCLIEATDVSTDPRFQGLPNLGNFGSYVGVPLTSSGGKLFGTLCHADPAQQAVGDVEFQFLNEGAKLLGAYLEQAYAPGGQRPVKQRVASSENR